MSSYLPRWRLPPSHQELLRSVLGGASGRVVSPEHRALIRRIASAPERNGFEPEDFLIAFKLALVDAANKVGIPPGPDRNDFLARLVTVYIEEFYRGSGPDGKVADANGRHELSGHGLTDITNSDAAHTSPDAWPSA